MKHHIFANFRFPIVLAPGARVRLDEETTKDLNETIAESLRIRGNFLDLIIHIEMQINVFLEKNMISKNSKTKDIFQKKILNSKKFDLDSKIKILSEILETKKLLKKEKRKELVHLLLFVKDQRNIWAHGPMSFKQLKKKGKLKFEAIINYINQDGESKEQPLTEKYYKNLNEKLGSIVQMLNKSLKLGIQQKS